MEQAHNQLSFPQMRVFVRIVKGAAVAIALIRLSARYGRRPAVGRFNKGLALTPAVVCRPKWGGVVGVFAKNPVVLHLIP